MAAEQKQDKGTFQQTEHQKKYDRQIRLWGAHGQKNLETGKIVMIGSNVAASEVLKNCVLPNMGEFTIIDDAKVSISDLGNNFFIVQDDVGKNRAECVTMWLTEMNPDVKGRAYVRNFEEVINSDIDQLKEYDIVVATQLYGETNRTLAKYCWENKKPFISIQINGMMARLRLQYPEITVMESHPSNDRTDLFVWGDQLKLFPELAEFCNSFDIDTDDVTKRAHLPCVALLAQYTKRYLEKHDNKLPSNFKEQTEFKDEIGAMGNSENFDDAVHWASQCYFKPRIDNEVQEVLKDPKGEVLDEHSSDFWILVRALRDFMENEGGGFLPCSTNIPDLTMDSESYVKLKSIYKARAQRDHDLIKGYTEKRLEELKKEKTAIPEEVIERFVRNVRTVKVVRTRSMEEEYSNPNTEDYDELFMDMSMFEQKADDAETKPFEPLMVHWYWAFRALDVFYDAEKRLPGTKEEAMEEDVKKLVAIQNKLFMENKVEQAAVEEGCLSEMVRFGGSEIHNMGAFVGGMGAQSIMKILLKQFFTFNHTYVFNGIHCDGAVFNI